MMEMILCGDALEQLRTLEPENIKTCLSCGLPERRVESAKCPLCTRKRA